MRSAPEKTGLEVTLLRWFIAGIAAVVAIEHALDADWSRTGGWAALSAAHVALALGAERDARGKGFLWVALAMAIGFFVARWV